MTYEYHIRGTAITINPNNHEEAKVALSQLSLEQAALENELAGLKEHVSGVRPNSLAQINYNLIESNLQSCKYELEKLNKLLSELQNPKMSFKVDDQYIVIDLTCPQDVTRAKKILATKLNWLSGEIKAIKEKMQASSSARKEFFILQDEFDKYRQLLQTIHDRTASEPSEE